jgi:uncharacterized protein YecE (DUF72 family)
MSLRVGTSGFDYRDWHSRFYPADLPDRARLSYYARTFDTVELNVTFYRMPAAAAFQRWREEVPDGFRFAVKASRYLTHVRRLRDPQAPVEYLMERASLLGDRLGPILLQLPPDLPIELDRLDRTLSAFGPAVPVAVEARHPSWFCPELRALLAGHRAALCLADRRGPTTPLWGTADWAYLRLHEGRAHPASCYGRAALRAWLARLEALWPGALSGYVFFNNDHLACAVRNGRTFQRLAGATAGRSRG